MLKIEQQPLRAAVFVIDVDGEKILSTPFRIKRNESVKCLYFDDDEQKYLRCEITMTGDGHLVAVDIDDNSEYKGMTWAVVIDELATPKYKFQQL